MSQGLGLLQREILDTLDDAKRAHCRYRGFSGEEAFGHDSWPPGYRWTLPGWVSVNGNAVRLSIQAYDLRASCNFLARRHGKYEVGIAPSFSAGFSRAAAALVERGLLIAYENLLPIEDCDEDRIGRRDRIRELQGGKYLTLKGRYQIRFVSRASREAN